MVSRRRGRSQWPRDRLQFQRHQRGRSVDRSAAAQEHPRASRRFIGLTTVSRVDELSDERFAEINSSDGEYEISNNASAGLDHQAIETFFAQQPAQLLLALKDTPEGADSVLDNTLVVYWNNESDGNSHSATDMPILLFGGKFLKLQGG